MLQRLFINVQTRTDYIAFTYIKEVDADQNVSLILRHFNGPKQTGGTCTYKKELRLAWRECKDIANIALRFYKLPSGRYFDNMIRLSVSSQTDSDEIQQFALEPASKKRLSHEQWWTVFYLFRELRNWFEKKEEECGFVLQ